MGEWEIGRLRVAHSPFPPFSHSLSSRSTITSTSKVVVAMSGGVDSSVAAAILVQERYDVIGATMQVWPVESGPEEEFTRACCSLSAVEDARRVAARIGIPHYVLNFKDIFQETVIDNFIEEYRRCLLYTSPSPRDRS